MPDGNWAISASSDKTFKMWDLEHETEQLTLREYGREVTAVTERPDGQRVISASSDRTLKIWNLKARNLQDRNIFLTPSGHTDSNTAIVVLPNGQRVVSASSDHNLKVWNLESGQELLTLHGHSDCVTGMVVNVICQIICAVCQITCHDAKCLQRIVSAA
jgi:WD40 repeat protein